MKRSYWVGIACVCCLLLAGSACFSKKERPESRDASGGRRTREDVVADVGGVAITVGQVRQLAESVHLTPREALHRLEQRELLFWEATRRGLSDGFAVRQGTQQALVQALLREGVEKAVPPQAISDDAVRAAYNAQLERFRAPERRASVHVLAKLGVDASRHTEQEAKSFIEQILERYRRAPNPSSVVDAYRNSFEHPSGFTVVGETVPPIDRGSNAAAPYIEALFSADGIGPVWHPVRTSFGFHAIVVTRIEHEKNRSWTDAAAELREELATRARANGVANLVKRLRRSTKVLTDEQGLSLVVSAAFERYLEQLR